MKVRLVPLSEHHECYSADDIEIWEVSRLHSSVTKICSRGHLAEDNIVQAVDKISELIICNWGQVPVVEAVLDGVAVKIAQDLNGIIGNTLWPSSVIASRFALS